MSCMPQQYTVCAHSLLHQHVLAASFSSVICYEISIIPSVYLCGYSSIICYKISSISSGQLDRSYLQAGNCHKAS